MLSRSSKRIICPVLSILTPCILGIVGMKSRGFSIAIWGQNPLAIFLLTFVSFFALKYNFKYSCKAVVSVSAILLGMTFLGPNVDGVHRWLRLPFFTLNISAIVIPIAIIALYQLVEEKQFLFSISGMVVVALLLCLQPDSSQLLAFSLPMIVLLLKSESSKIITGSVSGVLLILTVKSWCHLDALPPVDYAEGILMILRDFSIVLYIAGLATLFWIPVSFLISCNKRNRNIGTGLSLYYLLMILSTFAGNFPVPFMGYGVSSILGYYAAFTRLISEDKNNA